MRQFRTLSDLQDYVWESLPMRKHAVGREAVSDCVAVIIQEWPDDVLEHTQSGDTGELVATQELTKTVKRHMALAYGEQKFGTIWLLALQILLPIIIDLVLRWWRSRRDNRGKIRIWRRKWINGIS